MDSDEFAAEQNALITELESLGGRIRRGKSGKIRAADFRPCGQAFRDEHAESLSIFPDLIRLELAGTGVTDASLAAIGRLTNLTHLDLQQTAVTASGLVHLEPLTRLKMLLLSGAPLNREQLTPLRQKLLGTRIIFP